MKTGRAKAIDMTKRGRPQADGGDKQIGERVRDVRLAVELSQTQLSKALGVSTQQVQKYETGQNRISAARLLQIAASLSVPVAYFYAGDVGSAASGSADQGTGLANAPVEVSDEEGARQLVSAYLRIADPLVRQCLLRLAESLMG